ncbi:hypothetical protein ACRAWD_03510 [Caulobacter segnis]
MLKRPTDVTQLDGLVRYSRGVALSRLALVACFVLLLITFTPWRIAGLGILELGLYFALFLATELALRDPDPVKAHRRLALQSDILMFLLVTNACWLAVQIRLYEGPRLQVEAALLAICVLLFAALRVPHAGQLLDRRDPAVPDPDLDRHRLARSVPAQPLYAGHDPVRDRRAGGDGAAAGDGSRPGQGHARPDPQPRSPDPGHARDRAANRAKSELLAVASHEIVRR